MKKSMIQCHNELKIGKQNNEEILEETISRNIFDYYLQTLIMKLMKF